MAFTVVSVLRGPGEIAAMTVDVTKRIFTKPFQVREFIEQAWFITSVTLMPPILVSIPFGAVISLQVGNLTGQLGAQSFAGATAVLAVVREAAPIAAALIIAGAAGSAICSDLGSRKIREEIDAMEVLGVDPLERLVAPRVVATMFVALMIIGIVIGAGIGGGYFFTVIVQGARPARSWRTSPPSPPSRTSTSPSSRRSSSARWPLSWVPTRDSTPAAAPAASAGPSTRP